MDNMNRNDDYRHGILHSRMPLAVPYVPFQDKNPPRYDAKEALTRGTIHPGLDLPFKNIVNRTHPYEGTTLGELMELGFVLSDLKLYLDTHEDDMEVFTLYQEYLMLYEECYKNYTQKHGPISARDLQNEKSFTWLQNPWPWEYTERMD